MYEGVEFFAEKTRKNGQLSGTVLILTRGIKNGRCFAAIAMPRDGRKALPIVTWVKPEWLDNQCIQVSEKMAREIAPEMFRHVDAHHRSEEYRLMYQSEIRKPGRTPCQPAFPKDFPEGIRNVTEQFYMLYGS